MITNVPRDAKSTVSTPFYHVGTDVRVYAGTKTSLRAYCKGDVKVKALRVLLHQFFKFVGKRLKGLVCVLVKVVGGHMPGYWASLHATGQCRVEASELTLRTAIFALSLAVEL